MGYRRKAREIALQILYQIDASKIDADEAIELSGLTLEYRRSLLNSPRG